MTGAFRYLFSPASIGSVTVPNRIVNPAHFTAYAENNLPSERHAYYYAERARGGAGLIITEITAVHETSQLKENVIFGFDPRSVSGFRLIADMVHEHGTKIFGQLWHAGRDGTSFFSRKATWGPSGEPSPTTREIPHEMTIREIKEVVNGFRRTAANIRAAGYDGVEIHGGHGYLIHEFMSPLANRRHDAYGGSLENRLRLAIEVAEAVRQEVGKDFVVGMRISGDELVPGGLTLEDMKEVARALEETLLLDYLSVSVGNHSTISVMIGDMSVPLGAAVYLAAAIKEIVNLPVFTALRINDPVQAENILANGQADMICMCRALICDPELPAKAREGRFDEIRKCVACNQECRRYAKEGRLACTQNAAVGKEKEWGIGSIRPAESKKKVVVVGGGPAGMEAARVASLRGHNVVLYERENVLGGQVRIASQVPTRQELGEIIRYLEYQVRLQGVRLNLGAEATVDTVEQEEPDVVIVSTGSVAVRPSFPGQDTSKVVTAEEVIRRQGNIGERIVLVDCGEAHWSCYSIADWLASRGVVVDVVTHLPMVAAEIDATSLAPLYRRLLEHGVTFHPLAAIKEIEGSVVILENVFSRKQEALADVDCIVVAPYRRAQNDLYYQLADGNRRFDVWAIGDCYAPRKIPDAIREGHEIGRRI